LSEGFAPADEKEEAQQKRRERNGYEQRRHCAVRHRDSLGEPKCECHQTRTGQQISMLADVGFDLTVDLDLAQGPHEEVRNEQRFDRKRAQADDQRVRSKVSVQGSWESGEQNSVKRARSNTSLDPAGGDGIEVDKQDEQQKSIPSFFHFTFRKT